MVTAAGRTSVSDLVAGRFLRLAAEAEARNDHSLAREHFLTAVRHDPTPAALLAFGRFLADSGQTDDALLVLQDGWQLAKRRAIPEEIAVCCRRLAGLLATAGRTAQAQRFLQRAADAEMSAWTEREATFSSEQLLMESQFAERGGEIARAFVLCQAALESAPATHQGTVLRHRARLHLIEARGSAAAHDLLSAARIARDSRDEGAYAECLLELGHCLRSLGRAQLAIRCYRAAALRFDRAGRTKQFLAAARWLTQTVALARTAGGDAAWN